MTSLNNELWRYSFHIFVIQMVKAYFCKLHIMRYLQKYASAFLLYIPLLACFYITFAVSLHRSSNKMNNFERKILMY